MSFFKPLDSVVKEYVHWATSDHPRIGIGYDIMDGRTMGGAAHGEVILFQARSQVGKTTVASNVIVNNCPRPTVFFSLEMHARYIAMRLAAIHTGTPTADIEQALKETGRCDALQTLVDDYPCLAIPDTPALGLKDMGKALLEIQDKWQEPVDLVVIDYMELIGGVPSLSAVEKVDGLARKVKDFAREHDVVVLLLHQVGRSEGGTGAEPLNIASGRYGGETQADYVLSAYRPALRAGITQDEYLDERWHLYFQFLKTRGGSEIHPQGQLHELNPFTMKIRPWDFRPRSIFPTPDVASETETV